MAHFSPQFGHCFCHLLLFFLSFLSPFFSSISAVSFPPPNGPCPSEMMLKCAEPLQQLGISPGKNLVLLLLQLQSPSQLRKNCQAYAAALPCFRRLVPRCGVPSQAEILRQMENAHQFLCSPFSGVEQSQLLAHRVCIGRILGQMGSGKGCGATGGGEEMGARNSNSSTAIVLFRCRERCLANGNGMSESAKFNCLVRAWLSEQNLCLSEQLRATCGREAAAFYTKMQRKIFHAQFPVICEQNSEGEEKAQRKELTNQSDSKVSSLYAVTQATIFVTSKKRKKTVARLSEFKLKLAGGKRRSSTDSSTTKAQTGGSGTIAEATPTAAAATVPPTTPTPPSLLRSNATLWPSGAPLPPSDVGTAASSSPTPGPFASPSPAPLPSAHSFAPSPPQFPPPPSSIAPSSSSAVPSVTLSPPLRSPFPSSAWPSFSTFSSLPSSFVNVSSSERNRIIQLLAAQSVPFHFSSLMAEQLHKRTKAQSGRPSSAEPVPAKAHPIQSHTGASLPNTVRSSVSFSPRLAPSSARPPSFYPTSPPSPHSSSAPFPPPPSFSTSFPPPPSSSPSFFHPPHYFSSSSSLSDSSPLSSSLFLPPLVPFPSHPSPFSFLSWVNQFNEFHQQQQQDVPSQVFFFEVLPFDDYNP